MVVWDTRTNKDVGWVMVRKASVQGVVPEDMVASLARCQWRSWNMGSSEDCSGGNARERDGIKLKAVDEASTSIESKKESISVVKKVETSVLAGGSSSILKNHPKPAGKHVDRTTTKRDEENKSTEDEDTMKRNIGTLAMEVIAGIKRKAFEEKVVQSKRVKCEPDVKKTESVENSTQDVRACQECGKTVKRRRYINHLISRHDIRDMTECTVCRLVIKECDLLEHRKKQHPEKFKLDMVVCSYCQKKVRALEFDSHPCNSDNSSTESDHGEGQYEVEEINYIKDCNGNQADTNRNLAEDQENSHNDAKVCEYTKDMVNGHIVIEEDAKILCKSCQLFFLVEELKYHDCVKMSVVKLHRLRIVKKKVERISKSLNESTQMVNDEAKLDGNEDGTNNEKTADAANQKIFFKVTEIRKKLNKLENAEESVRMPVITKTSDVITKQEVAVNSLLENSKFSACGDLDKNRTYVDVDTCVSEHEPSSEVMLEKGVPAVIRSIDVAKIMESRENLVIRKIPNNNINGRLPIDQVKTFSNHEFIESNGEVATCDKFVEKYENKESVKRELLKNEEEVTEKLPSTEETSSKEKWVPRTFLVSAKVTEEPPSQLRRNEMMKFNVMLFDQNLNPLLVQSTCMTACSSSRVLQFRLELLQKDGTVTLQPLLLSVYSIAQPAVMLQCLQPGRTVCRQVERGHLQFIFPCSKTGRERVKVVIATKLGVLCTTQEVELCG